MARIRRIFRTRLWLYSLLCVLSVVARSEAATRVPVKMPTNETALSKGVATKGTGVVHVDVSEGEYIPGATIDKRVPVKTIKRIDYSIPRTITVAKSLLKANLAQALLGAAISGAVAAVGWVMSDDQTKLQKKLDTVDGMTSTNGGTYDPMYICSYELASKTMDKITVGKFGGVTYATFVGYTDSIPSGYTIKANNCTQTANGYKFVSGRGWPTNRSKVISVDQIVALQVDLTDSDYSALDTHINAQTADWIKSLVRDGCAGAMNVEACTQDLQDFHNVTGPASVPGPSTTTTGTYTRPDGTTGTTSSVTTTNYSLLYGDNYFDYSKSTTITNTKDGVTTDQSTTTEDPGVTEETPPEDEKEEEKPSPCTTNCDGPAYVDMYDKTDKTKEGELDSYKSKIQSVPIIAAVSGLFNVSVSAACPVWSYSGTLELVGASMPIDLVFDFQCQPWFTDLRPYVQAIMLIVCGLLAVRIGLL